MLSLELEATILNFVRLNISFTAQNTNLNITCIYLFQMEYNGRINLVNEGLLDLALINVKELCV